MPTNSIMSYYICEFVYVLNCTLWYIFILLTVINQVLYIMSENKNNIAIFKVIQNSNLKKYLQLIFR